MRKLYAIAVLLLLSIANIYAQTLTVTGKVTDSEDGLELPGVTVQIKDTDGGTITDFEGNFSIEAPSDAVLIFNYLGYQTQEVPVNNQTTINVPMITETEVLEEVVVIGYGVIEKGDITGVVKSVDEEQFNGGVIASPDQLLSGKVAGVSVINNSGEPGGQATVRIRGGTSISASNEPLYVIDGVPIDNTPFNPGGLASGRNPLNFLNPSEIENITVLKDASATAIYGSRGANGVIVITTKGGGSHKGKASEKPTITYDGSTAVSSFPGSIPVLTSDQFRAAIGAFDQENVNNPNVVGPADTDWFDEVTQTSNSQQHNLSIGANIQDGSYRFSTGYQQINGILKGSRNERYNINFNMSKGLLDNALTLRFSTKNAVTEDQFASNQIGSALAFNPTQPIYYDSSLYRANGGSIPTGIQSQFGGFTEYSDPLAVRNPVAENRFQKQIGRGFRSINNFEIAYNIPFVKGLSVRSNISFDHRNDDRISFSPSFLKSQQARQGNYSLERAQRQSFLYEGIIEYSRDIEAIDGKFNVLGGYSFQNFANSFAFFNHDSLFSNAFGLDAPAPRPGSIINVGYNQLENRLISFYGRTNLFIKDKYLFTATLRRDGSTKFGPDTRWGLFPAFGAGWRISNEEFYGSMSRYVNYLKLRAGYGITGNQEIGDYLYLSRYGYSTNTAFYQLGGTYFPTLRPQPSDPSIKWEETQSINIGLDWEIFKGKLAGTFEFYQKNTKDLLFNVIFPAGINVGDRFVTNIGEIRNQGVEVELSSPVLITKEYSWNLSFNAAYNQNEVLNLDNTIGSASATRYDWGGISGDVGQFIQTLQVGEAYQSFYTYEQLYDDAGKPIYEEVDQVKMYKDQNGDGKINELDRRVRRRAAPNWIFGLTSVANYKKFDLSFTFRAHLGNYVYNNFSSNYGELNRLTNSVPQNIHTSALETGFKRKQLISDYYLENASFLRLDNLTLGYTVDRVGWMRARVFVTGQNLFVMTGYSGFDPEISNGIDNNLYPRSRTYLGGVSLTF